MLLPISIPILDLLFFFFSLIRIYIRFETTDLTTACVRARARTREREKNQATPSESNWRIEIGGGGGTEENVGFDGFFMTMLERVRDEVKMKDENLFVLMMNPATTSS